MEEITQLFHSLQKHAKTEEDRTKISVLLWKLDQIKNDAEYLLRDFVEGGRESERLGLSQEEEEIVENVKFYKSLFKDLGPILLLYTVLYNSRQGVDVDVDDISVDSGNRDGGVVVVGGGSGYSGEEGYSGDNEGESGEGGESRDDGRRITK